MGALGCAILSFTICRAVAKGTAAEALAAIESAAQALEFRVKPLDAAAHRVLLSKAKHELLQELMSCDASDANGALDLGTRLAVVKFQRCDAARTRTRNTSLQVWQLLDNDPQNMRGCRSSRALLCRPVFARPRRSRRSSQGVGFSHDGVLAADCTLSLFTAGSR
jgi:hypothetical protein